MPGCRQPGPQAFFAQALHHLLALTCLPENSAQLPCGSVGFDCHSAQPLHSWACRASGISSYRPWPNLRHSRAPRLAAISRRGGPARTHRRRRRQRPSRRGSGRCGGWMSSWNFCRVWNGCKAVRRGVALIQRRQHENARDQQRGDAEPDGLQNCVRCDVVRGATSRWMSGLGSPYGRYQIQPKSPRGSMLPHQLCRRSAVRMRSRRSRRSWPYS